MKRSKQILCGAETNKGGSCRNRVAQEGDRCRFHQGQPLNAKRIMWLCFKTVKAVVVFAEAATLLEKAYPVITEITLSVGGSLFPESFWFMAFESKDSERMALEVRSAHERQEDLEKKYLSYSDTGKIAVEHTYLKILQVLDQLEASEPEI